MVESTSKITVHIDASDLAAFRELVERAERAAERTRVLTALRLPLRAEQRDERSVKACAACVEKDRDLQEEHRARVDYASLAVKRDEEIATLKLELAAWRKEHAAREQEIIALKKTIAHANDSRRELRSKIEVESAEHHATKIALRDALRDAAAYAKEAADYAATRGMHTYAGTAREDAARFDAARAALGIDDAGGTPQAPAAGS